jgi:hypothetical protein
MSHSVDEVESFTVSHYALMSNCSRHKQVVQHWHGVHCDLRGRFMDVIYQLNRCNFQNVIPRTLHSQEYTRINWQHY